VRTRLALGACLLAVTASCGGCLGCGGLGGTTSLERVNARKVVAVVERNMMASERGDARAYCATFTDRYLRDHFRGGLASCLRRFRGAPERLVTSSEVRYLGAVTVAGSDVDASVHYKLGKVRGLDYVMKFTSPPGGGPRRWLIDDRLLAED
jgi:hypothetical protein